ncbi:hypothetical protein [Micromonospora siamensis]|uniref:Uncharacterized protein n=1 Tax=Micromonospora siamensis TaxID=299152 RepID=A0A1C5IS74_9ACTN|nr:hypothetical protein [Micromonospora siamensis]SCG60839.1 hypothetical protein GA0074704_3723 [Micromonospora siamensis]
MLTRQRRRARAALCFAAGYGTVRLYWACGGRWGWTACDRTRPPARADLATGCDADRVVSLSAVEGRVAVVLCGLLALVAVVALRRRGPLVAWPASVAALALVVLSFPGHLLFELPAAAAGHPTDWRDVGNRLLLLAGGLLFARVAVAARRPGCGHPDAAGPRPVPVPLRGWVYAAAALPLLGFTLPHLLWLGGVPLGVPADVLAAARRDLSPAIAVAVTAGPALGGLLTLGLAHRWGQEFPRWTPWAGRPVPRALVLAPAGVVASALTSYGLIGVWLMSAALAGGRTTWAELGRGWAVAGTELVFLGWGVALGRAVVGYERLTRPRCPMLPRTGGTVWRDPGSGVPPHAHSDSDQRSR